MLLINNRCAKIDMALKVVFMINIKMFSYFMLFYIDTPLKVLYNTLTRPLI